jgi:hypothetical protein
MKTLKKTIALATGALIVGLAAGCVEQEPSMVLTGSLQFEGEADENGLTCEVSFDPEGVDSVTTRAQVDIRELEMFGQEGPPFETASTHPSFIFWAGVENLLEESTEVGAGGGGGGGNFQGLKQDQNSIMITGAVIRYPGDLNNFQGAEFASDLEKKELFSTVVPSGGAAAILSFPIFGEREIGKLKAFYKAAVEASPNVPAGTEDAIIPLIAEITLEGETFSGREVESNTFQFPIDLCLSCDDAIQYQCPSGEQVSLDKFETTSTCFVAEPFVCLPAEGE